MNFEGQNISLQDALFVDNITGDIERFRVRSDSVARVLVFPPVNNYHRFLIHKVVEDGFPLLATFSVGVKELDTRRTIICFQKHLLDFTLGLGSRSLDGAEIGNTVGKGLPPECNSISQGSGKISCDKVDTHNLNITKSSMPEPCDKLNIGHQDTKEVQSKSAEIMKENAMCSQIITITPENDEEILCIQNSEDNKIKSENVVNPPVKEAKEKKRSKRPDVAVYVPRLKRLGGATPPHATPPNATPQLSAHAPPFAPTSSLNANAAPFSPATSPPPSTELLDTDREEVVPDPVVEEIVAEITVAVGGVQIESPDIDYLSFQTSDASINLDQFGHVIELYDFPQQFKTNDLLNGFKDFTSKWDVKWVDDTHALGVFNSAETAAEALALRHPIIKTRPLNMATKQSKVKAASVCEYLLPYKPRPATSTVPARRFLSLALGYKVPEASSMEKERLDQARRRKEEDRREDRRKRKEEVGGREEDRRRRREDKRDYDCHDYRSSDHDYR